MNIETLQADNRRHLQRIAALEGELNRIQEGINAAGYTVEQAVANFKYWMADAENAKAQLKAAQEQEPVAYCRRDDFENIDDFVATTEPHELYTVKLYAAPVPAQQSPAVIFNGSHGHAGYVVDERQSAVAVPDDWVFVPRKPTKEMVDAFNNAEEEFQHGIGAAPDCHWTAMIDSSPKNSYVHNLELENKSLAHSVERYSHEYDLLEMQLKMSTREGDKLLKEIECLQKKLREKDKSLNHALDQLAQSPRITEHDDNLAAMVVQELYNNGGPHESQIDEARRIISFIAERLPNRITEQELREIAESIFGMFGDLRPDEYQAWMERY